MNYQLSRRYFLRISTATALSQLLGGCDRSKEIIEILLLENSIPPQLIKEFDKSLAKNKKVKFKPQTHILQIFDSLFSLQQPNSEPKAKNVIDQIFNRTKIYPSLATLGDTWLAAAIEQNLIQPLKIESLTNWQKLPVSWQKLVRRNSQGNMADNGAIYGAPYRWGGTVIAYRQDKLKTLDISIQDWSDLWRSELRDRISLLDSPREIIGLTLKKMGESYNTEDLDTVPKLKTELSALDRQTKLYSSEHYLEPLVLGDTWVAVGWSTDILPLLKRYPDIKFVIPQSGTSLWADLWVKPQLPQALLVKNGNDPDVIAQWIDYCWQPKIAEQISLFTNGISPILPSLDSEKIPKELQENVLFDSKVLNSDKSEFIKPLEPRAKKQYRDLWLEVRSSDLSSYTNLRS